MRRKQLALLLALTISLSTIIYGQANNLQQYHLSFRSKLKSWASTFTSFNLADFQRSKSEKFENIEAEDLSDLEKFYKTYKPLISFSPGNTKFTDIYSYQLNLEKKGDSFIANPEIDQSIRLCDLKTKNWVRIFFRGADNWIDEVAWLSDTKFILAGIETNKAGKRIPEIFIGDTNLRSFEIYKYIKGDCTQKIRYNSPKLKKLKIKHF